MPDGVTILTAGELRHVARNQGPEGSRYEPGLLRSLANELPDVRRQVIRLARRAARARHLLLALLELRHWVAVTHYVRLFAVSLLYF